jgi:hypothetical protein
MEDEMTSNEFCDTLYIPTKRVEWSVESALGVRMTG